MASTTNPGKTRKRGLLTAALSLLLVLALAATAWYWFMMRHAPVPDGTPPQPAAVTVDPEFSPVKPDAPEPTDDGIAKALAEGLKDEDLGELTGMVSDPLTGKTLWTQDPDEPRTPASNAKILTAAAALEQLKHDARLTTTVVAGDDEGEVILVGAGDPTLSAQPKGDDTFYTDAPRIADLADQLKKDGLQVTSVGYAPNSFDGPPMEKSGRRGHRGRRHHPDRLADGGRRSRQGPARRVLAAHPHPGGGRRPRPSDALGLHGTVDEVEPEKGAKTLAKVESAPLATRVGDMMRYSDNVLAETLAIELSESLGGGTSINDGAEAVVKVLEDKGFDTKGVTLKDSSGLSADDEVPARLLDEVVSAAADGKHPALTALLDTFPVAGGTGTLADRFDDPDNHGAGWVRAKTGTLTGVTSLTGIVQTVDGRVLAFAFMSSGTSPADARPAIDALAGALRECGCRG